MKISKIFHLLYFTVLCLPILAIPIFGIYAHRHNIDSYTASVQEVKVVDFNQILNPNPQDGFGIDVEFVNNEFFIANGTGQDNGPYLSGENISFVNGHKYYLSTNVDTSKAYVRFLFYNGATYYDSLNLLNSFVYSSPEDLIFNPFLFAINGAVLNNFSFSFYITDLSLMFGVGNEPTAQQFVALYPNDYYQYTLSRKELLYTGNNITYDDTDIGSQLIYTSYNTVNNYFNYDRIFNFGALYDWLQVNFFVGNAPLGFFIFWHLLIYWLLTSLLWLLFDVLIYVPMVIHKWLDKASM